MAKAKGKGARPAPKVKAPAVKPHRAKKPPTGPFTVVEEGCTLKHVSLSTEKHGDEDVRTATLSIEGVRWLKDQVDHFFEPYTWTNWFNTDAATKLEEPRAFIKRVGGKVKMPDKFKVNTVDLKSSNKTFKFRAQVHDDGEGETPAGNVSKIVFTPMSGGYVLVGFHLTVRPHSGEFDELVDAWGGAVKLTLGDITVEKVTSKQGELPLPPAADDDGGIGSHDATH